MDIYFPLTRQPKHYRMPSAFPGDAGSSHSGAPPFPGGSSSHPAASQERDSGGTTAAPLEFLHPHCWILAAWPHPTAGEAGAHSLAACLQTRRMWLWCVFLNQPIIALSSLRLLQLCCSTLYLKAPGSRFHRAFACPSVDRGRAHSPVLFNFPSAALSPCDTSPGKTPLTIPPTTRLPFVIRSHTAMFISFTPLTSFRKKNAPICVIVSMSDSPIRP